MQVKFTQLFGGSLKKSFRSLLFVLLLSPFGTSVFGQGAVYPLNSEVCKSTASYTLNWSGTAGSIIRWEKNDGSGWQNVANTNTSVSFVTPPPGQYQYRTYVDLGGGNFQYSVISTVTVYDYSQADASVTFTYDAATRCDSNNTGSIVLNGGYIGNLKNWVYSTTGQAPWNDLGVSSSTMNFNDLPTTTYFKAKIQNGVCPFILTTNTAQIDVITPTDGGTVSLDNSSICQGSTALMNVTGNVGSATNWQLFSAGIWTDIATGTNYTTSAALVPATYNFRFKASTGCKDENNATISSISYSPTVSLLVSQTTSPTNPVGDLVVSSADATVRSIVATPTNGTITRWEYSLDNSQWTPLTSNSTTYNYNNLTQTTYYRVITKNGACTEAASVSPVTITVAKGGTISASSSSFCSPSTAANLTLAGYVGTSWTWESSVAPFTTWNAVQSNVASITVSNLLETTQYRVNINSGKAYSNQATLTVNQPTVAGSLTASSSAVCPSDPTVRNINLAGNTGAVVRWESSTSNGNPWTPITTTVTSLPFDNLTQTTYYRAIVQNGACSQEITPSVGVTVVNGGTVTVDNQVCASDATIRTVSVSGHTGVVNYWELSEYDALSSTWGAYQNVGNGGSVNFSYSNLTKSTKYRAVITSSCATPVSSNPATITVYSASVGGVLTGTKTVRPNNNNSTISLAGNNGNVVRWELSNTGTAPWTAINNTTTSLTYNNLDVTTVYRAIIKNGVCAEAVTTNNIQITIANPGVVSNSASVCAGDPTVTTLTLGGYIGTISRWQRSVNNGLAWNDIPATANQVTLNYNGLNQSTLYRAVITEDGGDIYATPATITVNPLPVPDFTNNTACFGVATSFTNISTVPTGSILTSNWFYGDAKGSSITSPSYTYATAGTYPVKLVITTDKLCRDSIEKNITVSPLPTVDFTFVNKCEKAAYSFVNASSLAGAALTYAWTFGDGVGTSTSTDPNYTYNVKGNYNVKLVVTANGNCSNSATKAVNVYENPISGFSFTNVCEGSAMSFVQNAFVSDGNLNYAWDFGSLAATSTLANPTYKYTLADTFAVKLTVTTANGCSHFVTKDVQVYPMPVAAFTAPNSCLGNATQFSNSTTLADGSLTYVWDFKNGASSVSKNPTYKYAAAGSYYAKLTATSDRNCVNSIEKQVIVNYKPKALYTINNICAKDTVFFVNQSSSYGDSITYKWNFADGSLINTSLSPKKVYATAGTYNSKLIVTSTFGCQDSLSLPVNVYPNPVSNFTYVANTCFSKPQAFTSTSTVSTGKISNYLWDFSTGVTSNLVNPTYNFSNDGSYKVLLTVTTEKGCKDTLSKQVNISKKPVADFSFANICAGKVANFTNNSSALDNAPVYNWNFGDTAGTSTATSPTYTYTKSTSYSVKLKVSNSNSCVDSITKTITIYPNAVADFSKVDTCENTTVAFKNKSSVSSGSMSYSWNFGNGTVSINNDPSAVYYTAGNYNASLTVTTDKACVTSKTLPVVIYPNPQVSYTASDACYLLSNKFTNNSQIASGTMTYAWDFGDKTTSDSLSPRHVYNAPGTYLTKLTATSNKGCKAVYSINTEVFSKPHADFIVKELCPTQSISLVNISSILTGNYSSSWDLGNGATSTQVSPTTSYDTAATYKVRLAILSNKGCVDTLIKNVVVNPLPKVDFTNTTVCFSYPTAFTNNSSIKNGKNTSFSWDFADLTNSVQANPNHVYAKDGDYSVTLTVTSDKGCKDSLTKVVTVNRKPIAAFTVNNICAGKTLAFTNNSNMTTTGPAYIWSFNDSIAGTSTQLNPTYVFNKPKTYNVKLKVQNANTCSDSITKSVEIYPNAVVDFAKVDTCAATDIVLKNKTTLAYGAVAYNWDLGNGKVAINTDPVVAYATDGVFNVTLTATTDKSCVTSKMIPVTVYPNPKVTFSATDVCYQVANQFTNGTQINSGTATYTWDFGDQTTSVLSAPSHTYISPGVYLVKLNAVSDRGCKGASTRYTYVYPKPSADFSFTSNCAGKEVKFENISTVESGSLQYNWTFGDNKTSTAIHPKNLYSVDTTYNVTLISITDKGCSDTLSKGVTVYPNPIAKYSNTIVCDGNSTQFTNLSTIKGDTTASYLWDFTDLTNSVQKNPVHQFLNNGSYNVKLTVTSRYGCVDSYTTPVFVRAVPAANFSADPVCFGFTTTFKNKSSIADTGTVNYTWNYADGSNLNQLKEATYVYAKPGTYQVKLLAVTSVGNCRDSITLPVIVRELPTVILPNDTTVSRGFPVSINPIVSQGVYTWTPAKGLNNSVSAEVVATPFDTTMYILQVIDQFACKNVDTIVLNIRKDYALLETNESTISNVITPDGNGKNDAWVIPNITFYDDNTVYIFDRWGQEVYRSFNYQNDWKGTNKNGDQLPDGTYYFVVTFGSTKTVHKGAITILSNLDSNALLNNK